MKKIISIIPLLIIIDCLGAEKFTEKKMIAQAKEEVLRQLKDPDSAKFKNLKIKDKTLVCGEVNAKNSYGGYSGFTYFYVLTRADNRELETVVQDPDGKYGMGGVICKHITVEELIKNGRKD